MTQVAVNAIMCAAIGAIRPQLRQGERQCIYLDDRTVCTKTLHRAKELQDAWATISESLGFKENQQKALLLCANRSKQKAVEVGFPLEQIQPTICVLGVDLSKNNATPNGDKRLQEAIRRCERLQKVPVSYQSRSKTIATSILPLACWGWIQQRLSKNKAAKLQRQISKALWKHALGSPYLSSLLSGHSLDAVFQAGRTAMRMYPTSPTVGAWLETMGWRSRGEGRWHHPTLRRCIAIRPAISPENQHLVREAWRQDLWHKFTNSQRRDANSLPPSERVYNETTCARTRQCFYKQDSHARAVLVGAACSDAIYDVIDGSRPEPQCHWCSAHVVPDWHHHAWECSAFADTRPGRPVSYLAQRFGWQIGSCHDADILEHLAHVRAKLAESRRPAAGGARLRRG